MSNGNGNRLKEADFIGAGFHKVENVTDRPPRIKWGMIYQSKSMRDKIKYLEKLASVMNHAAYLIQNERNELIVLAEKKEQQIVAMKKALDQNNAMIQSEITKMNAEHQEYFKEIKNLRDRIRELERGGNG